MKFRVSIISREKKLFEGEVDEVIVPAKEGGMSILARHAPLLTALKKGKILAINDSSRKEFDIESGFIEVHKEETVLLVR